MAMEEHCSPVSMVEAGLEWASHSVPGVEVVSMVEAGLEWASHSVPGVEVVGWLRCNRIRRCGESWV